MATDSPELKFSKHAAQILEERNISKEWVERTVADPKQRSTDPKDPEVERFYLPMPEYGNRVLRVAVNTCGKPWLVVTTLFDRTMKGKL